MDMSLWAGSRIDHRGSSVSYHDDVVLLAASINRTTAKFQLRVLLLSPPLLPCTTITTAMAIDAHVKRGHPSECQTRFVSASSNTNCTVTFGLIIFFSIIEVGLLRVTFAT